MEHEPAHARWRTEDLFPLGGPMPAAHLIGRRRAVTNIVTRLVNGANTAVPGRRKEGKTSACHAALDEVATAHGMLPIEIDLYEVENEDEFLDVVSDAVTAAIAAEFGTAVSSANRLLPRLARLGVREFADEIGLDPDVVRLPDGPRRLTATLRLPEEVARMRRLRVVMLIDEAQRMAQFSDRFLRAVHRVLRDSARVTLLITGGDGSHIGDLLDRPLGPISDLVLHRELLPPVTDSEWQAGLRRLYGLGGCRIDDDALDLIVDEGKRIGVTAVHSTVAIAHHVHLQARIDGSDHITADTALLGFETAAADLLRLTEDE